MSSAAVVSGDEASLSSPRRDPDMEILSRLDRYIDRFRQGAVYAKVIDAVCESSQVDFEEGGVDQGTLELLRSEWRKKLSDLKVAQLPWDPPPPLPQIPPSLPNPAPTPKPPPLPQSLPSIVTPPQSSSSVPSSVRANDGTKIKPEPGSYPTSASQPNGYALPPLPQLPPGGKQTAQQRAAYALQQQYGQQAAPQINQLQQQSVQQRLTPVPGGLPLKVEKTEDGVYSQQPIPNLPKMQAPKNPVNPAQTDGAGDSLAEWKARVADIREHAAQRPGEGDRLMRERLLESQHRLEGGGLMLPLEQHYTPPSGTKRKIAHLATDDVGSVVARGASTAEQNSPLRRAQGDAPADDEDDAHAETDEDAINSDLDDSDDREDDENNEENTDQIMLCTYDKVQRVKNKWKCTLKDGIVKVGSSDYVFHKGSGEFEW